MKRNKETDYIRLRWQKSPQPQPEIKRTMVSPYYCHGVSLGQSAHVKDKTVVIWTFHHEMQTALRQLILSKFWGSTILWNCKIAAVLFSFLPKTTNHGCFRAPQPQNLLWPRAPHGLIENDVSPLRRKPQETKGSSDALAYLKPPKDFKGKMEIYGNMDEGRND